MKHTNIGSIFAIAMVLGIAGTANAGMIYDNGGPNTVPPQTGFPIKTFATADDFTLSSSATIESIGFYVQTDTSIAGWSQMVNYSFLSNAGGVPGSVLATGAAQNVVETDSGLAWCCNLEHAFLATFDLQSGFTASAGTTYWLQLSGATGSTTNVYWVTSGGGTGTNSAFSEGVQAPGFQMAFNLSGIPVSTQTPEPATLALAGLGFVTLALVRWSRSRQV
jgi:PEP-CTERM motif